MNKIKIKIATHVIVNLTLIAFSFITFITDSSARISDLISPKMLLFFVGFVSLLILRFQNNIVMTVGIFLNIGMLLYLIFDGYVLNSFLVLIDYYDMPSIYDDSFHKYIVFSGALVLIITIWNLIFIKKR